MIVLGIETSCDETAVGIVDAERNILANLVASQFTEHRPYGGVVPEIAARAHLDCLDLLIRQALDEASLKIRDLSGIAATNGPGLIGGVMVGAMTAKALAAVSRLPFSAVNHLEAHALTVRLTNPIDFPYLLLLVSGGHCQLLLVRDVGNYKLLGSTIDDAVGECFDKGAKLLGLGYPGGPLIEIAAQNGNPKAYPLPHPLMGDKDCRFSFSGLKTALRILVEKQSPKHNVESSDNSFVADAAASLQATIAEILADRTSNALSLLKLENHKITALVAAGGVASNKAIRNKLTTTAEKFGLPFVAPPVNLCTDNGVMVAWAGVERLQKKLTDEFDAAALPRWPLESLSRASGK